MIITRKKNKENIKEKQIKFGNFYFSRKFTSPKNSTSRGSHERAGRLSSPAPFAGAATSSI